MEKMKLTIYFVLSILLIVIGIKFSLYEGGVSTDDVYIMNSKILDYKCTNNLKLSDSLEIKFIGIDHIIVKPVVYCNKLENKLNNMSNVKLWLENTPDAINLWGLAVDGKKVIWPPSGLQKTSSINFYSILLIIWGAFFAKKGMKVLNIRKNKKGHL